MSAVILKFRPRPSRRRTDAPLNLWPLLLLIVAGSWGFLALLGWLIIRLW